MCTLTALHWKLGCRDWHHLLDLLDLCIDHAETAMYTPIEPGAGKNNEYLLRQRHHMMLHAGELTSEPKAVKYL